MRGSPRNVESHGGDLLGRELALPQARHEALDGAALEELSDDGPLGGVDVGAQELRGGEGTLRVRERERGTEGESVRDRNRGGEGRERERE